MAKYSKSSEAVTTNLLLWDVPSTEVSIDDVEKIIFYPVNSIDNSDSIDFDIPGFQTLMLDDVEILIEFNILTSTKTNPAANEAMAPVNSFVHSLWKNLDVRVNGFNIEQSMDNSYNIRAFIDTCLHSDPSRADYLSATEMFVMDTGDSKESNESLVIYDVANPAAKAPNKAATVRALRVSEGKTVTLVSKLRSSIFQQDKSLPTNLPISITLTRNKEGYCLLHAEGTPYKINLKKVVLVCTFLKPKNEILQLINNKIMKEPAIFHCPRGELASYTIPTGVESFTISDVYKETVPEWTAVFIQHRDCLKDKGHRNPYSFLPFESLQWVLNNKNYFPDTLKVVGTDLNANEVPQKYTENALFLAQIYESLGYTHRGGCLLNSENFQGHFMLCTALTPDRIAHKHLNLQRRMNVNLNINLGYTSTANHVLLIYNVWPRYLAIDGNRAVSVQ